MFRCGQRHLINNVMVWGGGTMGGGIGVITAAAGINVTVVEINADFAAMSKKNCTDTVMKLAKSNKKLTNPDEWAKNTIGNMTFTHDPTSQLAKAELVIEAILENIDAKQKLWKDLDGKAPKSCIFASNTSSLSITKQASAAPSRGANFAGLHFFSPVPMMKLVEVVRTEATSQDTTDKLVAYCKKIGKDPVTCKDTKGFIVNRLLIPLMLEAARMVDRGDASYKDIDTAMRLGAGHPMGPFTLCDSVGIDVMRHITDGWSKEEPKNTLFMPSKIIEQKFKEGKFGRKTGAGFYNY